MKIEIRRRALGFQLFALVVTLLGSFGKSKAQMCTASNSNDCSLMWLSGVSFKNSAGSTATYSGLNCANTGGLSPKLMTNGAVMDITPGEV
ncbi:MAG: hypothetical protein ACO3A5_05905, partial [Bacteroidia bacterium]